MFTVRTTFLGFMILYKAISSSLPHAPVFFPGDPDSDLTFALDWGDLEGVEGDDGAEDLLVFLDGRTGEGVGDRVDSLSDKSTSRFGAMMLGGISVGIGERGARLIISYSLHGDMHRVSRMIAL